jgi:NAD(P)H-flavin reductase
MLYIEKMEEYAEKINQELPEWLDEKKKRIYSKTAKHMMKECFKLFEEKDYRTCSIVIKYVEDYTREAGEEIPRKIKYMKKVILNSESAS